MKINFSVLSFVDSGYLFNKYCLISTENTVLGINCKTKVVNINFLYLQCSLSQRGLAISHLVNGKIAKVILATTNLNNTRKCVMEAR